MGHSVGVRARKPLDDEPPGDVALVLTELRQRGVDLEGEIFAAYFVGFADPKPAQAAAQQARRDGWDTAVFGDSGRHVVRLSRRGEATPGRLETDRDYLWTLAETHAGRYEGIALEEFGPEDYWDRVAARLIQRKLRARLALRRVDTPA